MEPVISGCYTEVRDSRPQHWLVRFLPDDGGRSASRRPKQTNDCTVRALAIAREISYDTAYDLLEEAGRKCGRGFNFRGWAYRQPWLRWRAFPAIKGQSRMNPAKFCEQYGTGRYIARTAKHVFAVVDGVVHDISSPAPDRCIYGVWEVL